MDHDRDFKLDVHGNHKVGSAKKDITESLGFRVPLLNTDGSNVKNAIALSELRRKYEGGTPKPARKKRQSAAPSNGWRVWLFDWPDPEAIPLTPLKWPPVPRMCYMPGVWSRFFRLGQYRIKSAIWKAVGG